jgi:uncharacterized protein YkwD
MNKLIAIVTIALFCSACVSTKDYKSLKAKLGQEAERNQKLAAENQRLKKTVSEQENGVGFVKSENIALKEEVKKLKADIEDLKQRLDAKAKNDLSTKEIQWNEAKYQAARTATKEDYLSREEQNVFYYLNLVRMNPALFAETFLERFMQESEFNNNPNSRSLFNELRNMQALPPIKPSKKLWEYAQCHAVESGKTGYTGHERVKACEKGHAAECCYYGEDAYSGLKIIIQLLIDSEDTSLSNRKALLSDYKNMGVSIQLHKTHSYGVVIDLL